MLGYRLAVVMMKKNLRILVGQITDVGKVRDHNEDSLGFFEPVDPAQLDAKGALYVVADGMGGHEAGETASDLAVKTMISEYYQNPNPDPAISLREAIQTANESIFKQSVATSGLANMGTTVVSAVVIHNHLHIGNVGDSRAYLVRNDRIRQISEDHSWVAEQVQKGVLTEDQAEKHPQRNILTRSVGVESETEIDIFHEELQKGDIVVLCSDGLHGVVKAEEIKTEVTQRIPQEAAENLVKLANDRGAPDNVTVIVLKILALSTAGRVGSSEKKTKLIIISALAGVIVLGLIAWLLQSNSNKKEEPGKAKPKTAVKPKQAKTQTKKTTLPAREFVLKNLAEPAKLVAAGENKLYCLDSGKPMLIRLPAAEGDEITAEPVNTGKYSNRAFTDLTVDTSGRLCLLTTNKEFLRTDDTTVTLLKTPTGKKWSSPIAIAFSPTNNFYVLETSPSNKLHIFAYSPEKDKMSETTSLALAASGNGTAIKAMRVLSANNTDFIYFLNGQEMLIWQKDTVSGLQTVVLERDQPTAFFALDGKGNIYLPDPGGQKVKKLAVLSIGQQITYATSPSEMPLNPLRIKTMVPQEKGASLAFYLIGSSASGQLIMDEYLLAAP